MYAQYFPMQSASYQPQSLLTICGNVGKQRRIISSIFYMQFAIIMMRLGFVHEFDVTSHLNKFASRERDPRSWRLDR